jgi:hypothetical protein
MHGPQLRDEGALGGVVDLRPHNIARQQVRGALDPAELRAHGLGHGLGGSGFCQARHTFQQDVPAGQEPYQQRFTKPRLAHHFRIEAAGNVRHHLLCTGQFRRFDACGRTGLKHWISP